MIEAILLSFMIASKDIQVEEMTPIQHHASIEYAHEVFKDSNYEIVDTTTDKNANMITYIYMVKKAKK